MPFVTEHAYMRAEFDWLAVDTAGRIGFFATGGDGPVPQRSLDSARALEEIHDVIRGLPKLCGARVADGIDYYTGDFFEVAERGIYAFNWDFMKKEYRLVAFPEKAVIAPESQLGALAQDVRLLVDFTSATSVPATIGVLAE